MQIKKLRGVFLCKKGGVRCLPWPMVAGHGEREKKRALMRKSVELGIFVGKIGIVGILEIGKSFGLEKKERIKEMEKGKEMK